MLKGSSEWGVGGCGGHRGAVGCGCVAGWLWKAQAAPRQPRVGPAPAAAHLCRQPPQRLECLQVPRRPQRADQQPEDARAARLFDKKVPPPQQTVEAVAEACGGRKPARRVDAHPPRAAVRQLQVRQRRAARRAEPQHRARRRAGRGGGRGPHQASQRRRGVAAAAAAAAAARLHSLSFCSAAAFMLSPATAAGLPGSTAASRPGAAAASCCALVRAGTSARPSVTAAAATVCASAAPAAAAASRGACAAGGCLWRV